MLQSKNGTLTYAHVDGPDDRWVWAIVKGFRDNQDYDKIVLAFDSDHTPDENAVIKILEVLS